MTTCPKCGLPIDPGAAFCGNCGQPLQATAVAQPTMGMPTPPASIQNTVPTPLPAAPLPQPSIPSPTIVSPLTQVLTNQPATPTQVPAGNLTASPVSLSPSGAVIPAYAVDRISLDEHRAQIKSIIALILGVIGIPGALFIPLIGLLFGTTGLVLSTTARAKYKHALNIFAIIFSVLAVLTGLGSWAWVVQDQANGVSSTTNTDKLTSIDTPCYTVSIDTGLTNTTQSGCGFDASNASEELTANDTTNTNVTNATTLNEIAPQAIASLANQLGASISSEQSSQFSGSPAFIATLKASSGNPNAVVAVVLHPSSDGNNIYLIFRVRYGPQQATLGSLESTWKWKK